MTQGLQLYNAAGDLKLTITNRVSRYIAKFAGVISSTYLGSAYVWYSRIYSLAGISDDGTWAIFVTGNTATTQPGAYPPFIHRTTILEGTFKLEIYLPSYYLKPAGETGTVHQSTAAFVIHVGRF